MVQESISHKGSDYLRRSLLKLIWEECVDFWGEEYDGVEADWVAMIRQSSDKRDDTFYKAYHAFLNFENAGVPQRDINEFARMVGFISALKVLEIIDERGDPQAGNSAPHWTLVEADQNDTSTDRHLSALASHFPLLGRRNGGGN